MKKRINLITIFIITVFFISIIAVSTPCAKSQQRTPPPDSQQPPPRTPVPRAQLPKSEFWDLAVDYCIINGELVDISPCDMNSGNSISVQVGQLVNFKCYYKIITIPVANITKADAVYWGSGNLTYKNFCSIGLNDPKNKQEMKSLPHFTWADVTKWQASMKQGMADVTKWQTSMKQSRKVWKDNMTFTWTPTQQNIGNALFHFNVDSGNLIKEPVGPTQNNWCLIGITVTP